MPTSPTAPTAVPDFPAIGDASYNTKAYNWATHMDATYPAEMQALATNAYNNAVEADTDATTATTQAGIATTQAGNAATSASTATTQAGIATTQAGIATTGASTATTQAGIATTKAGEADASAIAAAASAASISGGPVTSVNGMTGVVTGLQAALVSGTSIKTVNSTSLLGSGDVAVQATLVSGTSIKTVNSTSLLGSGDIAIGSGALTLLATLTPTAAANVDFLTTFSSTYDNYLIIGEGIKAVGASDALRYRFAVGGAVDTAANYHEINTGATSSSAATSSRIANDLYATGLGSNFDATVINANGTTSIKTVNRSSTSHGFNASTYNNWGGHDAYIGSSAISGMRLFWNSGGNFVAGGKIRVYGYANT